jgi:hypothetical protein
MAADWNLANLVAAIERQYEHLRGKLRNGRRPPQGITNTMLLFDLDAPFAFGRHEDGIVVRLHRLDQAYRYLCLNCVHLENKERKAQEDLKQKEKSPQCGTK